MLHDKNIICISSIDWDFVWQGHQEIMNTFAMEGNKVLFIENTGVRVPNISDFPRIKKRLINWFNSFKGIREERDNIFIYSPVILPFPYSRLAAFVNRKITLSILKRWMKAADFTNPVIWTFLPTRTALDLVKNIDNELSLYYCIADFDQLVKDRRKLRESEKEVLKIVDLVFAQGIALKNRCLKHNKNVAIFPFGVRGDLFGKDANAKAPIPEDLKNVKGIKLGYIGGLHRHIDYELLEDLADKRPDWHIVLIGPDQVGYSDRAKPGNITMLGMKKYEELPDYISNMSACLIPYKLSEYTNTVYPTKLNEYLFMGKPVISTSLPEIREFNRLHGDVVYVLEPGGDSPKVIEEALRHTGDEDILKRREAAMTNTWEKRIEEMSNIIEDKITEKAISSARSWRRNLAKIYHRSKIKIAKLTVALVILYLTVFYSPLLWFLAEPLKVSQAAEKADAIVVFGGGVGETGSPGKSTIERARFSVNLYKRGFSKKIIYSSGYTYKYNDAENMKLFALSMGIPAKNIILEQKANSTYENVKYTSEILKERGLYKVILVTSPYNMRRASLVFGHSAGGIKVIYVPVSDPQFYHREKRVKLEQIRAIMHEYLGIVYYFFKGYI